MDPILLQKQLRDNTNDLQDFCNDLKEWSSEMKRKEESLKSDNSEISDNKVRKQKGHTGSGDAPAVPRKPNKIKSIDYAAWEKFDVEKECDKIDKEGGDASDSELSDEFDESMKDQAVFEKEKGNKFVKYQKWHEAIECYTKAIACYGYDPIFYANRALCFLKKEKWKEAESDCTTALQLDKTYVKAYQRRAAAREKLDQFLEAKADLEKVLEYEPKNKESKLALDKLQELIEKRAHTKNDSQRRPVSKFTQMRQGKKTVSNSAVVARTENTAEGSKIGFDDRNAVIVERKEDTVMGKNKVVDTAEAVSKSARLHSQSAEVKEIFKQGFLWPEDDTIKIIEPISKAPHARSIVPLKRIPIKEIETSPVKSLKKGDLTSQLPKTGTTPKRGSGKKSVSFADTNVTICETIKTSPLSEVPSPSVPKESISEIHEEASDALLTEPTTSVQFFSQWKRCAANSDLKYNYLKGIDPKNLKDIFKEALDSKTFSDILKTLFEHSDDHSFVYGFLLGLSNVKRFCTLTFFMSKSDKDGVKAIVDSLKASTQYSEEIIQNLYKLFQL